MLEASGFFTLHAAVFFRSTLLLGWVDLHATGCSLKTVTACSFKSVGLRFKSVGSRSKSVGLSFNSVGLSFKSVGDSFKSVGDRFKSVGDSFKSVA